ncbi:MAG TPA: 50S ribosomal protein L13 [Spirochaetota bacterium]|nr:50S ribosomal protein L13 [Spirochaetota bacterium]
MKTFTLKEKDINKKWYIVDAEGVILGRLATNVASVLRGKNRPDFTPYMDCGDNVIVINAGKIAFTGDRLAKKYHHYSGYPGGMKTTDLDKLLVSDPERIITNAVKGMLPKGPLGRKIMRNLRVYRGAEHEHAAQKPQKLEIKA